MPDVGWFSKLLGRDQLAAVSVALAEAPVFTGEVIGDPPIGAEDVPPGFFGLTRYDEQTARVSRQEARQVPAIKRGRDLIAGSLATIPMDLYDAQDEPIGQGRQWTAGLAELLEQPERGIPRAVTIAKTIEDLIYDAVCWWLVVEYNAFGFPSKVIRLESGVDVVKQARQYTTKMGHHGSALRYAEDFDLIRFDSPHDPLLVAGARAIRTHIALDRAVNTYANGNPPLDYFTANEGADPEQDEVDAALEQWEEARRQHATGYVPTGFDYEVGGWDPQKLQLAEERDHASKELATLMGIQAERVNVSTTSRTYANAQQDRQEFVDFTLNAYATALAERLSMNDVTPRGMRVKWRWAEFLRTDDQTRMTIAVQGKRAGVLTTEESRTYFDPALPVMAEPAPASPAPADPATADQEPANA